MRLVVCFKQSFKLILYEEVGFKWELKLWSLNSLRSHCDAQKHPLHSAEQGLSSEKELLLNQDTPPEPELGQTWADSKVHNKGSESSNCGAHSQWSHWNALKHPHSIQQLTASEHFLGSSLEMDTCTTDLTALHHQFGPIQIFPQILAKK